jgi:hypothetical protein
MIDLPPLPAGLDWAVGATDGSIVVVLVSASP